MPEAPRPRPLHWEPLEDVNITPGGGPEIRDYTELDEIQPEPRRTPRPGEQRQPEKQRPYLRIPLHDPNQPRPDYSQPNPDSGYRRQDDDGTGERGIANINFNL